MQELWPLRLIEGGGEFGSGFPELSAWVCLPYVQGE